MDPKDLEQARRVQKLSEDLAKLSPLQQFGLAQYMMVIRRAGVKRVPHSIVTNAKTC